MNPTVKKRAAIWAAWATCVLVAALTVATIVVDFLPGQSQRLSGRIADWSFVAVAVPFAVVGALITVHRPGNRLGGLLLVGAPAMGVEKLAQELVQYGLRHPGAGVDRLGQQLGVGACHLDDPAGAGAVSRRPAAVAGLAAAGLGDHGRGAGLPCRGGADSWDCRCALTGQSARVVRCGGRQARRSLAEAVCRAAGGGGGRGHLADRAVPPGSGGWSASS
jgi:hypothetical protein